MLRPRGELEQLIRATRISLISVWDGAVDAFGDAGDGCFDNPTGGHEARELWRKGIDDAARLNFQLRHLEGDLLRHTSRVETEIVHDKESPGEARKDKGND